MSNSLIDQEDRSVELPDLSPDYREQEELRLTVASLVSVASDELTPLSPPAAKLQGEDLMVFSYLMKSVHLNPNRQHDQGVCHSLKQAYACIARLRPEDIADETDHAAWLCELQATRQQSYCETRERLVEIADWADESPSLSDKRVSDPVNVREARRRSELSAWVDQQIDELNQINL